MEVKQKCCLVCFKHEINFVHDIVPIVDRLKVIYGTTEFDDTLKNGLFCLSCSGRVYQLYQFFVIAIHTIANFGSENTEECYLCQRSCVIINKKEYNKIQDEVKKFLTKSSLIKIIQNVPENMNCCYSCYNYLDLYDWLHEKLGINEELKCSLLDFSSSKF